MSAQAASSTRSVTAVPNVLWAPPHNPSFPYDQDKWNRVLPYSVKSHREAFLKDLKVNLSNSILAGDISNGVYYCAKDLNAFLMLKYQPSVECRIWFARILLEAALTPNVNLNIVDLLLSVVQKLLKKRDDVPPSALTIDWRLIWDRLLQPIAFPRTRERVLPGVSPFAAKLISVVPDLRRFFSATAASEILEELLPDINPSHMSHAFNIMCFIGLLLPVETPVLASSDDHDKILTPSQWVPTIFSIWSLVGAVPNFDGVIIDLLARVAEAQVATPENVQWTEEQVRVVFAAGMRILDLPVGNSGQIMGGVGKGLFSGGIVKDVLEPKRKVASFAKFIVSTMYPEPAHPTSAADRPPSTKSLVHLKTLIQAVETFFNPSNSGAWTVKLATLVRSLGNEFLMRWRKEQLPNCKTPQHLRLTHDIKREFVLMLRPVALLGMFSKDYMAMVTIHSWFKNAVILEPELIVPSLLERIYPALENLTETHRTLSCISNLGMTITPMLSRSVYKPGARHLLPLLMLTLPGIDMNDPMKTTNTLIFIANALVNVPVIDVSACPPVDMEDENDETTRLSTAEFEPWALLFLERIFAILENLPQQHGSSSNRASSVENSVINIITYALDILCHQSSPEIHRVIVTRIHRFLATNNIPTAAKAVGLLAEVCSGSDPALSLSILLPNSIQAITSELANGASSVLSGPSSTHPFGFAEMSDSLLHWHQAIFMRTLVRTGMHALMHREAIAKSIDEQILGCKSRRGVKWAAKSLRAILASLLGVYCNDSRSVERQRWQEPDFIQKSLEFWGNNPSWYDVTINWHVPSNEELEFAISLLDVHVPRCLEHIKAVMNVARSQLSTVDLRRMSDHELSRWIIVLRNMLAGMSACISPIHDAKDTAAVMTEALGYTPAKNSQCNAGYLDPTSAAFARIKAHRDALIIAVADLAAWMPVAREDSTVALKDLIKCIGTVVLDRGVLANKVVLMLNWHRYSKSYVSTVESGKRLPRILLVRRAQLIHMNRLRFSFSRSGLSTETSALIDTLAELCISRYSEVRMKAQGVITKILSVFPGKRISVFRNIVAKISDESAPQHAIKGALHTLIKKLFLDFTALKEIDEFATFSNAVCRTFTETKPSMVMLMQRLFVTLMNKFVDIYIGPAMNGPARDIVIRSGYFDKDLVARAAEVISSRELRRLSILHDLVGTMFRRANDPNQHWRAIAMSINIIELLLREEDPVSPEIAKFAANGTVSDHPSFRAVCVTLLIRILVILKRRARNTGVDRIQSLRKRLTRTMVTRDETEAFLDASVSPDDSGSNDLFDSDVVGWLFWPSTIKVYRQAPEEFDVTAKSEFDVEALPFYDPTSAKAIIAIWEVITHQSFWSKAAMFNSQESPDGKEAFGLSFARLVRLLSGQFEDRFFELGPADGIKATIEKLCMDAADRAKQRASAEMFCGLLRGSKHWSRRRLHKFRSWASETLSQVFQHLTVESMGTWAEGLSYSMSSRDPRRMQFIYDISINWKHDPQSQSFFTESKKLQILRLIFSIWNWRLQRRSLAVLEMLLLNFRSPFKQVRETIGSLFDEILQIRWSPSAGSLDELLKWSVATRGGLSMDVDINTHPLQLPIRPDPQVAALLNKLRKDLETWRLEKRDKSMQGGNYSNASRTVADWLLSALLRPSTAGTYICFDFVIPELFRMIAYDDTDVQLAATNLSSLFPVHPQTYRVVPETVNVLLHTLAASIWHVKNKVLPVLQVFYFKHLHLISSDQAARILEVVSTDMLGDPQVEIRNLAAATLSGFIRCSHRDAIISLKSKFETQIKMTKLAKSRSTLPVRESIEPTMAPSTPPLISSHPLLIARHAAVLGLCALVMAFPYEVPAWMPSVLITLSSCINDIAPVSTTVSKTFADFRRTHQDTWAEDMLAFSEDEKSILSDVLISASYYA